MSTCIVRRAKSTLNGDIMSRPNGADEIEDPPPAFSSIRSRFEALSVSPGRATSPSLVSTSRIASDSSRVGTPRVAPSRLVLPPAFNSAPAPRSRASSNPDAPSPSERQPASVQGNLTPEKPVHHLSSPDLARAFVESEPESAPQSPLPSPNSRGRRPPPPPRPPSAGGRSPTSPREPPLASTSKSALTMRKPPPPPPPSRSPSIEHFTDSVANIRSKFRCEQILFAIWSY